MADDAQHGFAAVQRGLDVADACDGHVVAGFVVERAHDDAVAAQAALAVDLLGGQARAAQHGLPAVGLEAAEGHGHVDDDVAHAWARCSRRRHSGQDEGKHKKNQK